MRLWHKDLIPVLPRQQLLGQWRELCAIMRNIEAKGTPNHVLVNKVMDYPKWHFAQYIFLVDCEKARRGYKTDYKKLGNLMENSGLVDYKITPTNEELFAGWHNDRYLRQNYYNLEEKHDCGAISNEEFAKVREVCERVL